MIVRSTLKPSGQAPVAMDYAVERVDGEWKVYDVIIDGMSLVVNYRATFRAEIEHHGIDGLIAALAKKNRG